MVRHYGVTPDRQLWFTREAANYLAQILFATQDDMAIILAENLTGVDGDLRISVGALPVDAE